MRRLSRFALPLILLIQAVFGIARIAAVPLWSGHEADYTHVARFLVNNGRLPTAADYPDGNADTPQATQPPLIFLLYAPLVAAFDDASALLPAPSPVGVCLGQPADVRALLAYAPTAAYDQPTRGIVAAGYALRLVSLAFGLLAACAVYAAGRALFSGTGSDGGSYGEAVGLAGAAAFAFFPQSVEIATTISNDALLMLLAALHLWLLARFLRARFLRGGKLRGGKLRDAGIALGVALLTLLTKLNGWAVLALSLLVFTAWTAGMAVSWVRARRTGGVRVNMPARRVLFGGGLVIGLGAAALIALGAFNLAQYGSVFGRYRQLDTIITSQLRSASIPPVVVRGVADATRLSLLEPLDALNARAAFRTAYSALLLGGLLFGALAVPLAFARRQAAIGRAFLLLWATILIGAGLVLFRNAVLATAANTTEYSTAFIYAPLRYYAQAFPALALLLAGGAATLVSPLTARLGKMRPRLTTVPLVNIAPALFAAAFSAAFGLVCALWVGRLLVDRPSVEYLTPSAVEARIADGITQAVEAESPQTDAPRVFGYSLAERAAEGLLDVTVYAQMPPGSAGVNYLPEIAWGENRCQAVPGRGLYPTTRWPTDSVVAFTLTVPHCAARALEPMPVTLRWWASSMQSSQLVLDGVSSAMLSDAPSAGVVLDQTAPPLTTAASCPQVYGTIDDYRVIGAHLPDSARVGETVLPSVDWLVEGVSSPPPAGRVFRYRRVGSDAETAYYCDGGAGSSWPGGWQRGEYVYFDGCPFVFPPDAPLGDYAISVALIDTMGDVVGNTSVTVGTVTVVE